MKISDLREKSKEITNKIRDSREETETEKKTKLFFKKIFLVLKKNYHIATRNPKLYAALIIAPLLFVVLIGMAFNTSHLRAELKVSIYDESPDELIYTVFSEVDNVIASKAETERECRGSTERKENVVCIVVTERPGESYGVDLFFDYSRMSIYPTAYTTIGEVFNEFEQELTINILNEIRTKADPAQFGFESMQKDLDATKEELDQTSQRITALAEGLSSDSAHYEYKLGEIIEELTNLQTYIITYQNQIETYRTDIKSQEDEAKKFYEQIKEVRENMDKLIDECGNLGTDRSQEVNRENFLELITQDNDPACTSAKTIYGLVSRYEGTARELKEGLIQADEDLDEAHRTLEGLRNSTNTYIDDLEEEQEYVAGTEEYYSEEIMSFKESISEHSEKIISYGDLISSLNTELTDFQVALDPRDIVNKFQRNVRLISGTRNMLDYSLHLVIPFILLLSSLLISITLNRNEYKTSAFQRNKMLKNNFLIFSGNTLFILLIMLLELIFILVLFNLFFGANTLQNLHSVLLSATIFILIWVTIGFIISRNINSDEGAIFSGTILGLIVFFLSDVIVPKESFPEMMVYLYQINPFVYFSEIIRSNYLLNDMMGLFSQASTFLLITLGIVLTISIILVWRDMNENAS